MHSLQEITNCNDFSQGSCSDLGFPFYVSQAGTPKRKAFIPISACNCCKLLLDKPPQLFVSTLIHKRIARTVRLISPNPFHARHGMMRNHLFFDCFQALWMQTLVVFLAAGFLSAWAATPGVSQTEIRIGMTLPLTGEDGERAAKWLGGIRAAIHTVNQEGHTQNRKIRLVVFDDKGDASLRAKHYETLTMTEPVFALFGAFGPGATRDAIAVSEKTGIPLFGTTSGIRAISHPVRKTVYSLRPGTEQEIENLIHRFIHETGKTRVSVFHSEDTTGNECLDSTRRVLEKSGNTLHSFASYSNGAPDIRKAAQIIRSSSPDVVILHAKSDAAAAFIRTMRQQPSETVFIVLSDVDPNALADTLKNTGIGVVISQMVPFPYYRRIPVVAAYSRTVETILRQHPEEEFLAPGFVGLEGYLNGLGLCRILQEMKTVTHTAFIAAADNQFETDLGGYTFSFTQADHTGANQIYLVQIAPGGFVTPVRTFSEIYEFRE